MQVKKDDVKERILKSAKYEFNKYGYIRASMVRLATRAKMSVGNVYKYFKNKEDLLVSVVAEVYFVLPTGITKLIEEDANLDNFIEFAFEILEKYPIEFNILMQKAHGSKFADAKEKFVSLAYDQISKAELSDSNFEAALSAIASGAIEGICSLIDGKIGKKDLKNQLRLIMYFYFHDLTNRFKLASETAISK